MSSVRPLKLFSEAAAKMAGMLEKGKEVSDRGYQRDLLRDVLLYLGENFSRMEVPRLKGPPRVLTVLPANVPVIPFQMAPLMEAYNLEVVFKIPSSERRFYRILQGLTGFKFVEMGHSETLKAAREFDFVVGFGGRALGEALDKLKIPHRFFGPRFSIGVVGEEGLFPLLADALSFDGEACLAPVILFLQEINWEEVEEGMVRASSMRPPQRSFNRYSFEYYREFLVYYSQGAKLWPSQAVFHVKEFPMIIPQRSLFLVRARTQEEILDFLGERAREVQALISSRDLSLLTDETSASLQLQPLRSQFPPPGWFFQRGLTLENFFSP